MNPGLYLISNRTNVDQNIIDSMHRLRYRVFYLELGWIDGLIIENGMERDIYDTENAYYIVKINAQNEVIASCRLISTVHNYMLREKFSHVVEDYALPYDEKTWEITRVCMDENHGQINVLSEIMASIIAFGLSNNLQNFISFTTNNFIKSIRNRGWNPEEIKGNAGDSTVLLYSLDIETRTKIFNKGKIKSLEFIKETDHLQKININYQ